MLTSKVTKVQLTLYSNLFIFFRQQIQTEIRNIDNQMHQYRMTTMQQQQQHQQQQHHHQQG